MITLVIIGVVAAMTMPIMVADWQKQATISRLKKVYSTLSNAIALSVSDSGFGYNWDVPKEDTYQANKQFAETYLTPYLNVRQVCEYGKDDVCNYQITHKIEGEKYTFVYLSSNVSYAFALADGTTISIRISPIYSPPSFKVNLMVDINGPAKPNKTGRDIFAFSILCLSDGIPKLLPDSYIYKSREDIMESCKFSNASCVNLIINDGWQIKDDYPW